MPPPVKAAVPVPTSALLVREDARPSILGALLFVLGVCASLRAHGFCFCLKSDRIVLAIISDCVVSDQVKGLLGWCFYELEGACC